MTSELPIWSGTLREWRDALGISQGAAAELLDCGKRRIQGIEGGESGYRLTRPDLVYMAVFIRSEAKRKGEEFLKSQPIVAG